MNASAPAPDLPTPGRVFRSDAPLAARTGLIRVGTRGSALAIAQTTTVAQAIAAATGAEVALITIRTHGDVSPEPLSQLGGTGVFVSALRDALVEGRCDVAVHSLKDLPTGPCTGIVIAAIPARADARDALCARDGMTLAELPAGARVGTGSPRRAAQVRARRGDLEVCDLRGNVDTRLGRVAQDLDAVILAAAGLDRLGRRAAISERFPLEDVPTAPGQGALAIEVRAGSVFDPAYEAADTHADSPADDDAHDATYASAMAGLNDPEARACAVAERALLGTLEAGCAAPIGAWARIEGAMLILTAAVYRVDGGAQLVQQRVLPWTRDTAEIVSTELGAAVAGDLLANGAAKLAHLGAA